MTRTTAAASALAILLFAYPTSAETQDKTARVEECDYENKRTAWNPAERATDDNTFVFHHSEIRSEGNQPYVLKVDHGRPFQVLFKCTAPALFKYTIVGDAAVEPDSASGETLAEFVVVNRKLTTYGTTLRHDRRFLKYRVTARVREDLRQATATGTRGSTLQPANQRGGIAPVTGTDDERVQLFSIAFDLWVITKPDWKLSITAGVARDTLKETRYAIKKDDKGADIFVEDSTQEDLHFDMIALANVYYTEHYFRMFSPGLSFGIGTASTAPRFFFGPSLLFGRFFVLTAGWAGGWVAAPPPGQELGKPPINGANTLNHLSRKPTGGKYLAIGFTWIDRTEQFGAALAAASSASGSIGSCVTGVKPEAVTFDAKGEASGPITVEAGSDCTWIATIQSGSGDYKIGPASAKGKKEIVLSTGAAIVGGREDVLNIVGPPGSAAKSVKLTQGPKSCVDAVGTSDPIDFGGKTDAVAIAIKAEAGCKWTATVDPADAGFAIVAGTESGTGAAEIKITAPAAAEAEATSKVKVIGPAGAEAKTVSLKQPKKP